MKWIALALLVFTAGCAPGVAAPRAPSHEELRSMALFLLFQGGDSFAFCGGAPVAADTLRTAKHCLGEMKLIQIGETKAPAYTVTDKGGDVIEIKFDRPMFKAWLRLGTAKQGDRIRWWGSPKGYQDVYREGRIAAIQGAAVAVSAMICKGDSGSGMVNDAGELVAIISRQQPEVSECMFAVGESR